MGQREADRVQSWDERLLFAPLNELSLRARSVLLVLCTALGSLWELRLLQYKSPPFALPDASYYVSIAEGRLDLVPQPFASRPLGPLLARLIAHAVHGSVETGFAWLAYGCLAVTFAVVFWLAMRTAAPRGVLLAIVAVPFWGNSLHGLGLPDLLYAALLGCFLLALAAEREVLAAGLLFPLMVARESTSLTLLCLLAVGWRRLRWGGAALAVGATAAGAMVVRYLSAGNKGNPEHLPQTLYMLGKVPWNLIRTLGVVPWSNLYPYLCGTPAWQHGLHLGPVSSVGVCMWTADSPLQAIDAALTTFGLLPTVALLLWRGRGGTGREVLLRFCLLYGGVSFLLAPVLGTWYTRLFGYGWPLCLVAAPLLAGGLWTQVQGKSNRRMQAGAGLVLLIHLALCALGDVFHHTAFTMLAMVLEIAGFALLFRQRQMFAGGSAKA